MSDYIKWLETIEKPITRDDKYFYQIIKRLDKIIELLGENELPKFTKPIGTKDEPNEDVTVELIHDGNVDEKLGEEETKSLKEMTVKELRVIAKDLQIEKYSSMNKADLICAINDCANDC